MSKLSPFLYWPMQVFIMTMLCAWGMTSATETSRKQSNKTWDELEKGMAKEVGISFKSWKIDGKNTMFVINSRKVLTVNRQCGDVIPQRNTSFGCMALRELHYVSMQDLDENDLLGGKNPGSVLCKKSAKGTVVFGKDHFGNLNSFCVFPDSSMVSNDTLYYYGTRNAQP